MSAAYPFASNAKVAETLAVLEASSIASTQQTLLQQILVACAVNGGGPPPTPEAPTNLQATAGDRAISLTWDASSGAVEYDVLRNDTIIQSGLFITSANDLTPQPGELYNYSVVAKNVGYSPASNYASARAYVVTGPNQTPINLTTPTGSFTIGTILFSSTPIPQDATIEFNAVSYAWVGTYWLNLNTFESGDDTPIAGAFILTSISYEWTFWDIEP